MSSFRPDTGQNSFHCCDHTLLTCIIIGIVNKAIIQTLAKTRGGCGIDVPQIAYFFMNMYYKMAKIVVYVLFFLEKCVLFSKVTFCEGCYSKIKEVRFGAYLQKKKLRADFEAHLQKW